MTLNIELELAALRRMTSEDLRRRYAEDFGEQPRSRNRTWLVKRIAWRLQALAEGDLSERARQRAAELANDADLRTTAPRKLKITADAERRTRICSVDMQTDRRLPMPGSVITRDYKGQRLMVKVRSDGFEYEGAVYKSLTAVARVITGTHWNGYHFFGLQKNGGSQ